MKTKTLKLILAILFIGQFVLAQGWEVNINVSPIKDHGNQILIADNGDYLISGWSYELEDNPFTFLSRVSPQGDEIWTNTYYNTDPDSLDLQTGGMVEASDGGYILVGTTLDEYPHNVLILKVDENGDTLWTKKHSLPLVGFSPYVIRDITNTSDGGYAMTGSANSSENSIVVKMDVDANIEWMEVVEIGLIDTRANGITETSDGKLAIAGNYRDVFTSDFKAFIQKRELNGDEIWTTDSDLDDIDYYHRIGFEETSDGGFILAEGRHIYKTTSNGTIEWEKPVPAHRVMDVAQTIDGGYVFTGEFDFRGDLFLMKTDANGDLIWNRLFGGISDDVGLGVTEDGNGDIIVTGSNRIDPASSDAGDLYVIKTNADGNFYDNFINGRVFHDGDLNCEDDDEPGLSSFLIEAIGADTLYRYTDSSGYFEINLDTGDYEIRTVFPNLYWGTCIDVPYSVNVSNVQDTISVDFPAQILIECPYLNVDIGTSFLRRCFDNTYYVNYCNLGTAVAEDAEITIILDPFLEYVSASIDISSQSGDTLVFDVGDVEIGACGSFNFIAHLNCSSTVLGQTHCVTASISPDSLCIPTDPLWDGASLNINAECTGDSIFFEIENVGTGDMSAPRNYIVTEDVIMYHQGEVNLGSGESVQVLAMEANGSTWRVEVDQVEWHPGNSNPSLVVEGCVPDGEPFNLGFTNVFPMDDENPFVSIDCRENIGAYDPNDKQGFPSGWSDEHFVEREEDIEYLIRFQNTGTDTAFTVRIEDPISPYLDMTTIRPGASSHPYQLGFNGSDVITFTFDNIMLPDSNINEAASHGFVKFKISQKENLPLGTVFYNEAAIYFDFNDPVLTNETFHTIVEPLLMVDVEQPFIENTFISASPNPFTESTTIKVEGLDFKKLDLKLFDVNGRLIFSESTEYSQFILMRNGMSRGVYFFRIEGAGQLVGIGKIIVQ